MRFLPLPSITVKGKVAPITVYRPHQLSESRSTHQLRHLSPSLQHPSPRTSSTSGDLKPAPESPRELVTRNSCNISPEEAEANKKAINLPWQPENLEYGGISPLCHVQRWKAVTTLRRILDENAPADGVRKIFKEDGLMIIEGPEGSVREQRPAHPDATLDLYT